MCTVKSTVLTLSTALVMVMNAAPFPCCSWVRPVFMLWLLWMLFKQPANSGFHGYQRQASFFFFYKCRGLGMRGIRWEHLCVSSVVVRRRRRRSERCCCCTYLLMSCFLFPPLCEVEYLSILLLSTVFQIDLSAALIYYGFICVCVCVLAWHPLMVAWIILVITGRLQVTD